MPDGNRDTVVCTQCLTQMDVLQVRKYPGRWPTVLMAAGAVSCVFFVGPLVGIPVLLLGIYTATAKETISLCPKCGHYFKVWKREEGSV